MSEFFEILMILSFGASWPLNVMKSYKARTAKGKSLPFLLLLIFGYIAGIISKFCNEAYMAAFADKWYVLFFYFLNLFMICMDLVIYFRNGSWTAWPRRPLQRSKLCICSENEGVASAEYRAASQHTDRKVWLA